VSAIRVGYHHQLDQLEDQLVLLGSMAEKAILRALKAYTDRDVAAAAGIMHDDNAIDEKRFAIEDAALDIMARQQPMANDLRTLAAVLILSSELERIGDHAEGIAKIVVMLGEEGFVPQVPEIEAMADRTLRMLERSLQAFVERDAALARAICLEDDEVDRLQNEIYTQLLARMRERPEMMRPATYVIWLSHNLERIADRATNICERVIFLATGRMEELNVSVY
jgi:phosphate transport system protein